jgi:TonB family protein
MKTLDATALRPPRLAAVPSAFLRRLASVGAGAAVSALILFAISKARLTEGAKAQPMLEDLRTVVLPAPPPPPAQKAAVEPPPPTLIDFEPEPSDSPIKVTASLPAPDFSLRPPAQPELEFGVDAFRPDARADFAKLEHVFQRSQVDQRPIALFRKAPEVPTRLLKEASTLRVTLVFIVNIDGTVQDVRVVRSGGEEVDGLMVEAIREWRFKPAVKSGRKVRCITQQLTIVKSPGFSPFQVH